VGELLVVFGGADSARQSSASAYGYDTRSASWSTLAADASLAATPLARSYHAMARVERRLYVHGGQTAASSLQPLADLLMLDVDSLAWSSPSVGGVAPLGRKAHSLAAHGSRLLLFGGEGSGGAFFNDLYELDVARVRAAPPAARDSSCTHVRGRGERWVAAGGGGREGGLAAAAA